MDGRVKILISPAYHIITILPVSVFIAWHIRLILNKPRYSRCCSVPWQQRELPFVEDFRITELFSGSVGTQGRLCGPVAR